MRQAKVKMGTSGWHYRHWRGRFYPPDLPSSKMLEWYTRFFKTVELNNSFYRLPAEGALAAWRETVPPGFVFAVKGSRFITHQKKLHDPERAVATFLSRIQLLGPTLGPILFQLPPRWRVNLPRLEDFLQILPRAHRYVFEFRDPSWSSESVYRLLRRHNAALCLHDWRGEDWPWELTADFTYIRFHGVGGRYQGDYPANVLRSWASRIRKWEPDLESIYVYFNNDQHGYAIKNAQTLRELLNNPRQIK